MGSIPYVLTVADAPVDGFWSITLYNGDGYMQKNKFDAYSVNNVTATKNPDGSVDRSLWRVRGQSIKLSAHLGWLELCRATVPAASRNSRWLVDVSGTGTNALRTR